MNFLIFRFFSDFFIIIFYFYFFLNLKSIYLIFIFVQVTWQHLERPITLLIATVDCHSRHGGVRGANLFVGDTRKNAVVECTLLHIKQNL